MQHHKQNQRQKHIPFARLKNQSGISTVLLASIVAFLLIVVGAGVYVYNNYESLIAHGITAAMNAVIQNSDLPVEDRYEIAEIISQIKDSYLADDITSAELGLILEAIGSSPALTIGLVTQFQQSYIVPSNLSSSEKFSADINLNRLARGLSEGSVDWVIVNDLLSEISELGADGTHHLKAPSEVSDDEIRQVLATVKNVVDEAGISEEKIYIDISDEFKKSVEQALGRSLFYGSSDLT